ncbi:MAG TPA: CoA pyrophosphatase [Gemmatimonadales bacterium]|nr:CoA pyrophosphatase [Gemmatimonadales bacterium]
MSQPLNPLQQRLARALASRPARTEDDPALSRAAVAVIFAPDPDAILLIRRAERTGDPWSGQMGLPGGRFGVGDLDLLVTAIREATEEVGIRLERHQLVGALDDVAPRSPHLPQLMVRPYVFVLPERPTVAVNYEVADHSWVSVEQLLHPDTYRSTRIEIPGLSREFPAYHIGPIPIWGMTERILTPLLQLLS